MKKNHTLILKLLLGSLVGYVILFSEGFQYGLIQEVSGSINGWSKKLWGFTTPETYQFVGSLPEPQAHLYNLTKGCVKPLQGEIPDFSKRVWGPINVVFTLPVPHGMIAVTWKNPRIYILQDAACPGTKPILLVQFTPENP